MADSAAQTVHILAFVCDKDTQATISNFAAAHPQQPTEIYHGGVKEAIEHLSEHRSPPLLLVDLSESSLPISDLQKLIGVCEPGVDVVAIGIRNDVSIFRDVLKMGVKDYLAKPLTPDLLERSLSSLGNDKNSNSIKPTSEFMEHGQLIAFIGARGGVGTSTCAANTAWILAEERHRYVSLVDFNLHNGTQARQFNFEPNSSLYQALESAEHLDEVFIDRAISKYSKHLSILAAEEALSHKMDVTVEAINRLISILTQRFHYTIVDLPSCFDHTVNETILEKARSVIIVADLTLFSLRDTVRLLSYCNSQKPPGQRHIVLINRHNEYNKGSIDIKDFEKAIQKNIDAFIPFDATHALEAINTGQPAVCLESIMKKPFLQFVDHLAGEAAFPIAPKGGLINRLLAKFKS